MTRYLGLDIGGANLKLSDGERMAISRGFPLWQRPDELADAATHLLGEAPPDSFDGIALTMTGELADCFETKREGVRHILAAVRAVAGSRPVLVYALPGCWQSIEAAAERPLDVAAANWHALATAAALWVQESPALVIDVGSTTCDVVPVIDGRVVAQGQNDPQRLLAGELLYTGVRRSPVCAVTRTLPWRGRPCPVAQERFATTLDAYLITGDWPEDADDCDTADGRPALRHWAHDRLARMICADREMFDEHDALAAAHTIEAAQLKQLEAAIAGVLDRLPGSPAVAVISGCGEFLAAKAVGRLGLPWRSLATELGADVSSAAAAWAVARLASQR